METKCEMCERTDILRREFIAGVAASLCPRHQTDVHTYVTTELPITEFHARLMATRHASSDPLLFSVENAKYLDLELEIHRKLKKFIYGEDDG